MGKVVTAAIRKGGTGKTTCTVNLARMANERGYSVCLIDLDQQGNATENFIDQRVDGVCVASDLFEETDVPTEVCRAEEGVSVVPADVALLNVEQYPLEAADDFVRNVGVLASSYDLVVIDTPPTLGFCMLAPLMASEFAFSPMVPDSYSVTGVNTVIERIAQVQETSNPELAFLGVLINKFNRNDHYQKANVAGLKQNFPELVQPYEIGMRSAVTAAAQEQRAVWNSANSGARRAAAKEFRAALGWMLDEMKFPEKTTNGAK